MKFEEAVKVCLKEKYYCFRGRATRSEFWWFALFVFLANCAVGIVSMFFPPTLENFVSLLFSMALLLPNLGVAARRLHDRNLSGWWQTLPLLLSLLALVALAVEIASELWMVLSVLSAAAGVWFLVMLILPGTPGPNRFGPDPLERPSGTFQAGAQL